MRTLIVGSDSMCRKEELIRAISEAPWKISSVVCINHNRFYSLIKQIISEIGRPLIIFNGSWFERFKFSRPVLDDAVKASDAVLAVWDGKDILIQTLISISFDNEKLVYIYYSNKE